MNKLDRLAQRLEQKHRTRLDAMTRAALQAPQATPCVQWLSAVWLKPAMITAFTASIAAAAIVLVYLPGKKPAEPATFAALPAWVTDTDIPLTLLENIEFYDWLSQQPGNPNATLQNRLVLADNHLDQLGIGRRYPSADLAQRFSGRFATDREAQR